MLAVCAQRQRPAILKVRLYDRRCHGLCKPTDDWHHRPLLTLPTCTSPFN